MGLGWLRDAPASGILNVRTRFGIEPLRAVKATQQNALNRRNFLRKGLAVAGAASLAAKSRAASTEEEAYTYNLAELRKVDAALIRYAEAGRIPSPRGEPRRIEVVEDSLWVAAGEYLSEMGLDGRVRREIQLPSPARSFAVAKDLIYIGLRDHLEVFDRTGKRQAAWPAPEGKPWFSGIGLLGNEVFAADAGNRVVLRHDATGKVLGKLGQKDPQRNILGFVIPSPYFDLKTDAEGLVWAVNPGRHRLEAYTREGEMQEVWGVPGFAIQGFCGCCNPSYFARLGDGRFVTSEKGLPRIKVYSAKGDFECVVAGPDSFPAYLAKPNVTPLPMDVAVDAAGRVLVADVLGKEIRVFQRKSA